MRTSIAQKQRERFLLERFAEQAGLSIKVLEERESPDFLIDVKEEKVGVELTELCILHGPTGSPARARESIANRIVSLAQRIYQESGAPPAHVSICFTPTANLKGIDRDRAAQALVRFVQKLNLACWQRVDVHPYELDESYLPDELSFIHALGVPQYELAHWAVADAGWAAPLTVSSLQSRVDEKAAKIQEYKTIVATNWLVIVSDGTKPSQMFNTPPDFDPASVVSPFSRTFYYGYPDRMLIELAQSRSLTPALSL